MSADLSLAGKKRIVKAFLEDAFNSSLPLKEKRQRMLRHAAPDRYRQHSPGIADGLEPLLTLIAQFDVEFPEYAIRVVRLVAEGDLVFAHCHYTYGAKNPRGKAIAEVFRLEGDQIVEHWDVIQDIPELAANSNGMF